MFVLPFMVGCTHKDMKNPEPELELQKDIDLGLILDTTAPVQLFIPITNVSKRTITIHQISKDCSCISVTIDKRKLEPGDMATLKYTANIFGKTDRFASDVVIESDASERFDEIQIKGKITGQIRVRPRSVIVLTGEQDAPGTFTVFSDDQDGKWNYTGFSSGDPQLQVSLGPASSSPTTSTYTGTVTVSRDGTAKAATRYRFSSVTLNFANDQIGRHLNVILPVEIAVRRTVTVDPPQLNFSGHGARQKRAVLVQSVQDLAIDAVRCASPAVSAAVHRLSPKTLRVDIVFDPNLAGGSPPENLACDLLSDGKTVGRVPISIFEIP